MHPVDESNDVDLAAKVGFLRRPDVYPEPVDRVSVIETHLSWVFLTPTRVYKLKKPAHYAYVDLRRLTDRQANCNTEVRLNRVLAPDVYLGVVALCRTGRGNLQLEGDGRPVDYLVKMRRLPEAASLSERIARHRVNPGEVDAAAQRLARFYRDAEAVETADVEALADAIRAESDEVADCLGDSRQPRALRDALLRWIAHHLRLLISRRIIEAHGDLRPQHIYLGERPLFIDRLEFNRRLRMLDPCEELAFLALECERLRETWIGERFISTYLSETGDKPPADLLAFYKGRRALLWALLAARHMCRGSQETRWQELAETYLGLGLRAMESVGGSD